MVNGATVAIDHWVWDAAHSSVVRALDRARAVTVVSGLVASAAIIAAGWSLTSGIARESLVIYGIGAGAALGYVARLLYVITTIRWAVEPVRTAIVPALLRDIDRMHVVL
jgi:hypothetical protein